MNIFIYTLPYKRERQKHHIILGDPTAPAQSNGTFGLIPNQGSVPFCFSSASTGTSSFSVRSRRIKSNKAAPAPAGAQSRQLQHFCKEPGQGSTGSARRAGIYGQFMLCVLYASLFFS